MYRNGCAQCAAFQKVASDKAELNLLIRVLFIQIDWYYYLLLTWLRSKFSTRVRELLQSEEKSAEQLNYPQLAV